MLWVRADIKAATAATAFEIVKAPACCFTRLECEVKLDLALRNTESGTDALEIIVLAPVGTGAMHSRDRGPARRHAADKWRSVDDTRNGAAQDTGDTGDCTKEVAPGGRAAYGAGKGIEPVGIHERGPPDALARPAAGTHARFPHPNTRSERVFLSGCHVDALTLVWSMMKPRRRLHLIAPSVASPALRRLVGPRVNPRPVRSYIQRISRLGRRSPDPRALDSALSERARAPIPRRQTRGLRVDEATRNL